MARTYWFDKVPKLLRETPFRRYWTGQSLSLLGDQIGGMALPLTAVLLLGADSKAMGLLSVVARLPSLLFSIHAGAWVDRFGRRRQIMLVADMARAVFLTLIPLAYCFGRLSLTALLVIEFLVGIFSVLFRVSSGTVFVSMVPQEGYVEANSLIQWSQAMAFLVGPSIGGFLVQVFSAPVAMLGDACSFLASAISLASIHPAEPPVAPKERGHTVAGLRFVWSSPVLRDSLTAMATVNFFRATYFALYVLYVSRNLHVTPAELGIIIGPGSIGAVFASGLAGWVSKRIGLGRTFLLGAFVYTAPVILVPMVGGTHLLVVAGLFLAEFLSATGLMVLEISYGSITTAAIPDRLRARVGGALSFIRNGVGPLGALLGGVLPTLIGLRATLWVATVGAALGCLWLLPSRVIRLNAVSEFAPQE